MAGICLAALGLACVMWFIGISYQQPVGLIPVWAGSLVAAVHGFVTNFGGVSFGLPPTLLTVGIVLVLIRATKRVARALDINARYAKSGILRGVSASYGQAFSIFSLVYLGLVTLVSLLLGRGELTLLGSVRCLTLFGVVCSARLLMHYQKKLSTRMRRYPWFATALSGFRLSLRTFATLIILGVVVSFVAVITGWNHGSAVLAEYSDPRAAAIGLGIVQVLYAPTLWMLSLAWSSGGGFNITEHSVASPLTVFYEPVPAIPVLAVVPAQPPLWSMVFAGSIVLLGIFLVFGRKTWRTLSAHEALLGSIFLLVLIGVSALFCRGGLTSGGMSNFGISQWYVPVLIVGECMLGMGIGRGLVRFRHSGVFQRAVMKSNEKKGSEN